MDAIVKDAIKSGIAETETLYVSKDGRSACLDITNEWRPGYVRYMTIYVEACKHAEGDEQGVAVNVYATWTTRFSDTPAHACYYFCVYDDLEDAVDVINSTLCSVGTRSQTYIFERTPHLR